MPSTYIGISEVIRRSRFGAARALNEAANDLKVHSLQITPMEFGPLRASVEVDRANHQHLRAQVSYNTKYAAAQHEGEMTYTRADGTIVHWVARNYTTPGTGSKFLERPLLALVPHLAGYIARGVRSVLGG